MASVSIRRHKSQEQRYVEEILAFLTKKEGIETQAFIEHYENNHVPLICDLAPTPIVYKRNFLMRGDEFNKEAARSTLT